MRVVILVPRRNDNGHRDKLWAFCRKWWGDHHEPMTIYEGHHNDGPFNRSAGINTASDAADADCRWDVALIIDSDTISQSEPVQQAIARAYQTGGLVVAHDRRHMLTEKATQRILAGDRSNWKRNGMISKTYRDSVSCAVAVSRETWDKVGGFDDRFVGWGFEDTAFHIAVETITSLPIEVIHGECFHLWHATGPETSRGSVTYQRNHSLKRRYEAVRWQPEKLMRLLGRGDDSVAPGTIPRILHRTVPERTSEQIEGWWQRFGELHPDWDLRTYREPIDPADWPMTGMMFAQCQNGAQKAGLIRLEAVYTHGGIYVDSDVEPYRSFEPLLPLGAFAAWEDEKVVPDAVLGAAPGHPAFMELIGRAREAIMNGQDAWHSGPGGTTEILPGRNDVLLLPPGAFYPAHYLEKTNLGKSHTKPWVFCEHKWHHSWGTPQQHANIEKAQRRGRSPVPPTTAPAPIIEQVMIPPDLKIAVCIPWNDTDDPWRRRAFDWCHKHWADAGLPVYDGDGVSRSAMRNAAARKAIHGGAEILFFADADTWVPIHQLVAAAILTKKTNRLAHAFDAYVRLGSNETKRGMARIPDARALSRLGVRQRGHMSGAAAITVDLWQELGSYDERFTTWGFEDRAFDLAAGVIGGGIERVTGTAVHWYHPPAAERQIRPKPGMPSVDLVLRYCEAAATVPGTGTLARLAPPLVPRGAVPNPDLMRAILSEPGGPLAVLVPEQAPQSVS